MLLATPSSTSFFITNGLEELDGHFLRHAALVHLQFRADDDNASAGVVNTLAEQVLAEAALLALEHIATET